MWINIADISFQNRDIRVLKVAYCTSVRLHVNFQQVK